MSLSIPVSSQNKKPFHRRNGSDELDVFEAARYFSGATENLSATHKNSSSEARNFNYNTRPFGRMSLDMPNPRDNSIPLQLINKEKFKQPSSPGGKLAHFLNSIFNQTSSKKSKSKTKSTKDEDESLGGWRRKRRSSISHFTTTTTTTTATTTSTATTTAAITSDSRSPFSTSKSSGFTTPPSYHVAHTPTKATSYSYLKPPPTQITKIPFNRNLNKIENFAIASDLCEKSTIFRHGFSEKVRNYDEKQDLHHHHKYVLPEDIKEFKNFDDDDGEDSDSSSDLFEITNCDLPVYETTHMDISIKRV